MNTDRNKIDIKAVYIVYICTIFIGLYIYYSWKLPRNSLSQGKLCNKQ